MILVATIAFVIFWGCWLSSFQGIPYLEKVFDLVPGLIWLLIKVSAFLFLYIWMRATFPRYRYDQIMRLGWKVLIPITLIWIVVESFAIVYKVGPWFS